MSTFPSYTKPQIAHLLTTLKQRIVVIDGAMGTMIRTSTA
jgi:Methionine synthase I (cobalamin-dependent), methyltransferase domain